MTEDISQPARAESASPPLRDVAPDDGSTAWAMVEASPDALVMVDERGVIELVNAQTEKLFGYDRGDLMGRDVEVLVPDGLRQAHRAHRTRYRAAPDARAMGSGLDLVARRSDGTEIPVEISLSPMRSDGRLRIIAAIRDISERVERNARDRQIRRGLDLVEDGVFMFEGDTLRFNYVNDGAIAQVGYTRDELLSMTPLHIQPEFSEEAFRGLLDPLTDRGKTSAHFTTVHRHCDGTDIPVEVVLQAMPPFRGGPTPYVALVRDISERRAQAAELARAQARSALLEDRERIGREMHDSVISRLFATGLALDATSSMLESDEVRARVGAAIDEIDDAIKEIRAAVYGTRLRPSRERGIHARIAELVAEHERLVGFGPRTELRGPLDALDDDLADQVLATLREAMTNSVKYAAATRLDIELELAERELRLVVSDDGVGFDPQSLPDANAEGGHGLHNMARRAQELGGTCVIESAPGKGTTVTWSVLLDE